MPRKEEVLDRLGEQASVVRRKLGESLSSIKKFDVPIVGATTSSLEALQAYSLSIRAWNQIGIQAAIPYLKRAIELDPNFALVYARLAVAYYNLSYVDEAEEYAKEAYSLRERTTGYERYYIEGLYYNRVTGQYDKALQVYGLFKSLYPRSIVPYNNSGVLYLRLGQCEKALSEYRESARRAHNTRLLPTLIWHRPISISTVLRIQDGPWLTPKRGILPDRARFVMSWPFYAMTNPKCKGESRRRRVIRKRNTRCSTSSP